MSKPTATQETKELLKDAAIIAAKVTGHTLWITVVGGILSIIFFLVGVWSLTWVWAIVYGVIMIVGCPILYFFIGQTYGINSGIYYLLKKRTAFIWRYVLMKLFERLEKKGKLKEGRSSGGEEFLAEARHYLKELPGVPWGLRHILKVVLWLLPFNDALEDCAREAAQRPMTSPEMADMMAPRLSAAAAELLFEPSLLWFWLLVGLQVAANIAFRVFL